MPVDRYVTCCLTSQRPMCSLRPLYITVRRAPDGARATRHHLVGRLADHPDPARRVAGLAQPLRGIDMGGTDQGGTDMSGTDECGADQGCGVHAIAAGMADSLQMGAVKAAVGEISDPLRDLCRRHCAVIRKLPRVDLAKLSTVRAKRASVEARFLASDRFEVNQAHCSRVFIAKMGRELPDQRQRALSNACTDLDFEIQAAPLSLTPKQVAAQAVIADMQVTGSAVPPDEIPDLVSITAAFDPGALIAESALGLRADLSDALPTPR